MLASIVELEDRLGVTFTAGQLARAEAVLTDASELVLEVGDATWTDETVPGRAKSIVLQAARRQWTNPDGVAQSSVGDVSVSYSRTGVQGSVYLTRDENRTVRRLAGRLAGSVTLVTPYNPEANQDA